MKFLKLMGARQYLLVVLAVVAVGLGVFYWRTVWKNRGAEVGDETAGKEFVKNYEQAMMTDDYGGKTPEETLKLFVDALRKEDVELASKYFMVDDFAKRDKWIDYLKDVKKKGLMKQMADDISRAEPDLENRLGENDYKFVIYEKSSDSIGADIDMEKNSFSNLWKIENL